MPKKININDLDALLVAIEKLNEDEIYGVKKIIELIEILKHKTQLFNDMERKIINAETLHSNGVSVISSRLDENFFDNVPLLIEKKMDIIELWINDSIKKMDKFIKDGELSIAALSISTRERRGENERKSQLKTSDVLKYNDLVSILEIAEKIYNDNHKIKVKMNIFFGNANPFSVFLKQLSESKESDLDKRTSKMVEELCSSYRKKLFKHMAKINCPDGPHGSLPSEKEDSVTFFLNSEPKKHHESRLLAIVLKTIFQKFPERVPSGMQSFHRCTKGIKDDYEFDATYKETMKNKNGIEKDSDGPGASS